MPWRLKDPGHQEVWYWHNKPKYWNQKIVMVTQQWSRWWLGTVGCQVNFLAFKGITQVQYQPSCFLIKLYICNIYVGQLYIGGNHKNVYPHFISYLGFRWTEDQIHNGATKYVAYPILSIPGDFRSQGIRKFGIDIISLKIETKKLIMISQHWSRWWLGTVGCQVNSLAFEEYITHIQYWHSCIFNQIVYVIYVYRVMSLFSSHINHTCTTEPIYIMVCYRGYWVYHNTDDSVMSVFYIKNRFELTKGILYLALLIVRVSYGVSLMGILKKKW